MNIKKLISNKYVTLPLVLLAGILVGGLVFHRAPSGKETAASVNVADTAAQKNPTIWTCSMHPQIRMDHPGKCPICGMDLIPLAQEEAQHANPDAIVMSEDAAAIAGVQTVKVATGRAEKDFRLFGKIQSDEKLLSTQPAHISGRIEKLLVNFTGDRVRKGQVIARIYSPPLITAQQELLEALNMGDSTLIRASREKLRQWKLTDAQINEIATSGKVKSVFDVESTVDGVVTQRKVDQGDYIQAGTPLFEMADLSRVWVLFDAYESDLPWVKTGDKVSFTVQSLPGRDFTGTVSFIDPVMDPQTRISRVRVEAANPGDQLKPGMFATGDLKTRVSGGDNQMIIPHSAVLWTGTRSIVYVKVPDAAEPSFMMREITLGPDLGENYVVKDGLKEGDEIVTNGTFNVDAAAQLLGKPSMMDVDDRSDMNGVMASKHASRNPELISQIDLVFNAYRDMKNALVASDAKRTSLEAGNLRQVLSGIKMSLIPADRMGDWMKFIKEMNASSEVMSASREIEEQRKAFSGLSDDFYKMIKEFGTGQTVYYQFCPMAFDNKGAFWLSEKDKVFNPYFGDAMLNCGETREVLKANSI